MSLKQSRIKDKACTICDGIQSWGKGYRAVSKKRCDTCGDRKINFRAVNEVDNGRRKRGT